MLSQLSGWLVKMSSHNLWDWAGAAGSFVLGVTAIFGGFVALKSFIASSQAASHAHMHQMFQRFLEERDKAYIDRANDIDFGGSTLYFLEEVFAWTAVETTRLSRWWMLLLSTRAERARKRDILASWRSTVVTQLLMNRERVLPSLRGFASCYGIEFITFAARHLNDRRLNWIVRRSRRAVTRGQPRPPGHRERRQRRMLSLDPPATDSYAASPSAWRSRHAAWLLSLTSDKRCDVIKSAEIP